VQEALDTATDATFSKRIVVDGIVADCFRVRVLAGGLDAEVCLTDAGLLAHFEISSRGVTHRYTAMRVRTNPGDVQPLVGTVPATPESSFSASLSDLEIIETPLTAQLR
jgi:hypothetical protein